MRKISSGFSKEVQPEKTKCILIDSRERNTDLGPGGKCCQTRQWQARKRSVPSDMSVTAESFRSKFKTKRTTIPSTLRRQDNKTEGKWSRDTMLRSRETRETLFLRRVFHRLYDLLKRKLFPEQSPASASSLVYIRAPVEKGDQFWNIPTDIKEKISPA